MLHLKILDRKCSLFLLCYALYWIGVIWIGVLENFTWWVLGKTHVPDSGNDFALQLQMGASPEKSGCFWHHHVFSPPVSNRLDWYMQISNWFKLLCSRQSQGTTWIFFVMCFWPILLRLGFGNTPWISDGVQIWNGSRFFIFPFMIQMFGWKYNQVLIAWYFT
jgi:hypothetical protein